MKTFLRPENASYGHFAHPRPGSCAGARRGAGLAAAPAEARPLHVVALGDSLTAGYGLPPGEAFPDVLARALKARGLGRRGRQRRRLGRHRSRRAGALRLERAGGHRRADRRTRRQRHAARHGPRRRRGGARANSREGARGAYRDAADRHARARPISAPTINGASTPSIPIWPRHYGVALYPFFLDGVAGDPKLNQKRRIAPDARRRREDRRRDPAVGRRRVGAKSSRRACARKLARPPTFHVNGPRAPLLRAGVALP